MIVLVSAECVDAVKKSSRNMSCMCAFICVTVVCEFVRVVTGTVAEKRGQKTVSA